MLVITLVSTSLKKNPECRVESNEAAIDGQVEAIGCDRLEAGEVPSSNLRPASPKGDQLLPVVEAEAAKDAENPR